MSRKVFNRLTVSLCCFLFSVVAFADGGTASSYTPYSIFALGDLAPQGTAYNRSMGGVGIASRNNRFINILNPAAVTARDSLSFMVDFSVSSENKIYRQDGRTSARNLFNISDCVISFPIYRSSAMMVGIMPYSGTGYDFKYYETDKKTLADIGGVSCSYNGLGGIYQMFAAAGVTFFKRLSVGAELFYYFGNIEHVSKIDYSDTAIPDITETKNIEVNCLSGKFGMQYEQPIGSDIKIGIGATYKLPNDLGGYLHNNIASTSSSTVVDTLSHTPGRLVMPAELGIGLSLNYSDKLRFGLDYTRSDWRNSHFDTDSFFSMKDSSMPFSLSVSESVRFGMEWVPNRNDIRYYFKKVAYRAGACYRSDYFSVSGKKVNSFGITLGATLPVFRWYNGITIGLELGRRGNSAGGLIQESYFNISAGVNLFDIWFQKPKYD